MISNYIKFAWRNLTKNKIFSFINIAGLAIGLACCMLIAIFVYDELSYDRYPSQAFNIYRLGLKATANGEVVDWLNNFAYRIDLEPCYFIGAELMALVIAWLTVSMQAIKAAVADPDEGEYNFLD